MINRIGNNAHYTHTTPTAAEIAQRRKEMFTKLDVNGDGSIDVNELKAGAPKDGRGPDATEILKQADTDGNGSISEQEHNTFFAKMEEQHKSSGMPPGPPPRDGAGSKEETAEDASVNAVFDPLDTDKDGKVSIKELLAAAQKTDLSDDADTLMKLLEGSDDSTISKKEFISLLHTLSNRSTEPSSTIYDQNGVKSGTVGALVDDNA